MRKQSPVKKQPGKKGEAENPKVETSPQEEELDIGKLRTVEGQGRVTVPADEWIHLMEFVQ